MSREGGHTTAHDDLLGFIEVRPIFRNERAQWDQLMQEHHYLGFRSMAGESLRYAAGFQDRWLALLVWCVQAP